MPGHHQNMLRRLQPMPPLYLQITTDTLSIRNDTDTETKTLVLPLPRP
jgi:hypothetical protein